MTRTEAAAQAEGISIERGNEALAKMGLITGKRTELNEELDHRLDAPAKPARAPRSDKGQPRKPRPSQEATPGVLTEQQWARLCVLHETVTQTAVDLYATRLRHERAAAELADYSDSLKQVAK